jgi:hypothetical protein
MCLKDLRERFGRVDFRVSAPLVPFRETVATAGLTRSKLPAVVARATPCKSCVLKVRALSLPLEAVAFLEGQATSFQRRALDAQQEEEEEEEKEGDKREAARSALAKGLQEVLEDAGSALSGRISDIWAVSGGHEGDRIGANMLLNCIPGYVPPNPAFAQPPDRAWERLDGLENAILAGFHIATAAGPLCEEPLTGVCFELHAVEVEHSAGEDSGDALVDVTASEPAPLPDLILVLGGPELVAAGAEWECGVCLQTNLGACESCLVCMATRPTVDAESDDDGNSSAMVSDDEKSDHDDGKVRRRRVKEAKVSSRKQAKAAQAQRQAEKVATIVAERVALGDQVCKLCGGAHRSRDCPVRSRRGAKASGAASKMNHGGQKVAGSAKGFRGRGKVCPDCGGPHDWLECPGTEDGRTETVEAAEAAEAAKTAEAAETRGQHDVRQQLVAMGYGLQESEVVAVAAAGDLEEALSLLLEGDDAPPHAGGEWTCGMCLQSNDGGDACGTCATVRPALPAVPEPGAAEAASDSGEWTCGMCLQSNDGGDACGTCATVRPALPAVPEPGAAEAASDSGEWTCGMCLQSNDGGDACGTCATARPEQDTFADAAAPDGEAVLESETVTEPLTPTTPAQAAGPRPAELVATGFGQLTGTVISTMTQCCRAAFEAAPRRLVEPLYRCEVTVTPEVLGQAHAVLAGRRSKVIDETIKEGSLLFNIESFMPVVESFASWAPLSKQEQVGVLAAAVTAGKLKGRGKAPDVGPTGMKQARPLESCTPSHRQVLTRSLLCGAGEG